MRPTNSPGTIDVFQRNSAGRTTEGTGAAADTCLGKVFVKGRRHFSVDAAPGKADGGYTDYFLAGTRAVGA